MFPAIPQTPVTEPSCRLHRIDVGPQEHKVPAVFFLLLDHGLDLPAEILPAGVFRPVGGDDEHHVSDPALLRYVLLAVRQIEDGPTDGVQQGGRAAHLVLPLGHGTDGLDVDAVMEQLVAVVEQDDGDPALALRLASMELKPPMVSCSISAMDPLLFRMNISSVRFCSCEKPPVSLMAISQPTQEVVWSPSKRPV